jgi:hypothetical protein
MKDGRTSVARPALFAAASICAPPGRCPGWDGTADARRRKR